MIQQIFIWFCILSPVILTVGMLYGDYQEGDFVPFWQKRKRDVNSGAKFG
jgi:hypothetical protein